MNSALREISTVFTCSFPSAGVEDFLFMPRLRPQMEYIAAAANATMPTAIMEPVEAELIPSSDSTLGATVGASEFCVEGMSVGLKYLVGVLLGSVLGTIDGESVGLNDGGRVKILEKTEEIETLTPRCCLRSIAKLALLRVDITDKDQSSASEKPVSSRDAESSKETLEVILRSFRSKVRCFWRLVVATAKCFIEEKWATSSSVLIFKIFSCSVVKPDGTVKSKLTDKTIVSKELGSRLG